MELVKDLLTAALENLRAAFCQTKRPIFWTLRTREWRKTEPSVKINDVVCIKNKGLPSLKWPLARVFDAISGASLEFLFHVSCPAQQEEWLLSFASFPLVQCLKHRSLNKGEDVRSGSR